MQRDLIETRVREAAETLNGYFDMLARHGAAVTVDVIVMTHDQAGSELAPHETSIDVKVKWP